MINILIPLSGKHTFRVSDNNNFPKILTEIHGKLLIERAANPFIDISGEKKIIVAVPKEESEIYKLESILLLLDDCIDVCTINSNTQGAACSALLAIDSIDLDKPLIISNFEQVLDVDLNYYIKEFGLMDVDAGVLTFEAIHPKWSFVKADGNGNVFQAAEKIPISKNAIAGFYYFKTGLLFVESVKKMIRKGIKTKGMFYISPCLNEVILTGGKVSAIEINKNDYVHINDEHALSVYESKLIEAMSKNSLNLVNRTKNFASSILHKRKDIFTSLTSELITIKGDSSILIELDLKLSDEVLILNSKKYNNYEIIIVGDNISVIKFFNENSNSQEEILCLIKWDSEQLVISIECHSRGRINDQI